MIVVDTNVVLMERIVRNPPRLCEAKTRCGRSLRVNFFSGSGLEMKIAAAGQQRKGLDIFGALGLEEVCSLELANFVDEKETRSSIRFP
jgi:hypothetical protein